MEARAKGGVAIRAISAWPSIEKQNKAGLLIMEHIFGVRIVLLG
jgi:hypothetical protein